MRLLPPALLAALLLSACAPQGLKPPADYALSGAIAGDWRAGANLRLALVGTGVPVAVTRNSNRPQNVVPTGPGAWTYGFDLPNIPNVAGVYQVVAFDDTNNDAQINLGEPLARNRQWLVFSPAAGTSAPISIPEWLPGGGGELLPEMNVSRGWNVYDAAQGVGDGNPRPVTRVGNYDLRR